jgi:UPF0755 protein
LKFIKVVFALIFVSIFFGATYLYFQLKPMSGQSEKVIIEVEPGPFVNVIDKLYDQKLIHNKKLVSIIATLTNADKKIKMGEYEITSDMWPQQILNTLVSGKSVQRSFTVQEGLNIFEIANTFELNKITSAENFLKLVRDPKYVQKMIGYKAASLEGYLYPDTYFYTKGMSLEKIIQMMVDHFNGVIKEIAPALETDKALRHKMITLASMIEKETGAPEERPTISSVFYNRMKKNMRFQSDPTIMYGIAMKTGSYVINIKKSDILDKTPYNTYTIPGLPIGPISNPGKDAIIAALKPDKSEYLYFVSMNEGRHYFSRTYQEHEEAVKKYQKDRRAREGKSWRNPKK